ncbi:MAG: PilZ domain-containing protein [Candidatus Omnitrophica bacterium]|nr:PilZ domain-containing protein [Candidatus Omnitrophota bacterium]MDD5079980.1 PilZ domain-containing protein [Candidatus Omnitrophota bacterium]
MAKKILSAERRQYIRLDSVFPVQFRLVSIDGLQFLSDWIQGFTHNISKGGILLDSGNLDSHVRGLLKTGNYAVLLRIRMPLNRPAVDAQARIAWVKEDPEDRLRFFIGLSYEKINPLAQAKIIQYARAKKLFLPFILTIISVLIAGFVIGGYVNMQLVKGNKALVQQLVNILQESSIAKQKIKDISREKEDLHLKIGALQLRLQNIDEEKALLEEKARQGELKVQQEEERARLEDAKNKDRLKELNATVEKLAKEKSAFQEELLGLQHKENKVTEELLRLDERKVVLEKANFDKMYRWLTVHQNQRTGMVMSFEGDNELANWAFIYDQSLALQAYTNFSDFERSNKLMDFFVKKAKRQGGMFYNAYYVSDGTPAEYILHCGPNIWLGIAVLQYGHKTGDPKYLHLAEEIAQPIMALQAEDKDGGIRGGPDVTWYATEHNLDGYAFFNMLYKATGKQVYLDARDKMLNWLIRNTYNQQDIPIMRGKGDSTIATDTYAWSIAAIGPEKLSELGLNPDKIMEFAETNCAVEVFYPRIGGGNVKIKGFDFAPQRHLARGGVVSSEWTAQMVISFRIMSEYYHKKDMAAKAKFYQEKADEYLSQLCNMIINSPSPSGQGEGCLPYASCDFVDTGHGWSTPKGKATGSVSGTAYTIFAYYHYNPLEIKE